MAMPWTRAKKIASEYRAGVRDVKKLTALFDACFRIQREACAAAGRHIPIVVENVCGAQSWVGRAQWHYGSFYLWGDVPALMPMSKAIKNFGGSWFNIAHNTTSGKGRNPDGRKQGGTWFDDSTPGALRSHSSKSPARKAASARIAKIPLPLSQHIARIYKPMERAA